jgi:UDP-N-acetyl-D-galactosamine dehydrogenase
VHVHDPLADSQEAVHEYGVELKAWEHLPKANAIVAAVAHKAFQARPVEDYVAKLAAGGLLVDVKCQHDAKQFRAHGVQVWRL